MHKCEFCHSKFTPRPQVKNARACGKKVCQKARQKANEEAWHSRNPGIYDAKYHQVKRRDRLRRMSEIVTRFSKCLETGATLLGEEFELKAIAILLTRFFLKLGIRFTNKLCKS